MRLSGLASGFDTDTMVQEMMKIERMKVNKYEQNRQIALWRQESYNNLNKMFANFIINTKKDIGLKQSNSTGSLFDSSYKNLSYIRRATSSDETVAKVSSTNKAANGSYTFTVDKLAKSASFTSAKMGNDLSEYATTVTDDDGKEHMELEFKVNGQSIKISKEIKDDNTTTITMDDVVKAINTTKVKTYKGEVVIDNKVGDVELTPKEQKEIKEVSLGITAFYDKKNERLFMQTEKTGTNAKIKITEGGGFFTALGSPGPIKGEDAVIKLNETELTYESNNISLNGVDIELRSKSTSPVTVNVSSNTDGIMEKIEKLVADYNELVDMASKLAGEKKYSQYKPLSSEERKAMSEEDLKLWDEKAKSGLLNRDETLERTLQSIRTDLYRTLGTTEGKFNHITQIGISTEKYARGTAGGKLQIDTDRLRQAIEEDAEGVMELLFTEPTAKPYGVPKPDEPDRDDEKYKTDGIFNEEEFLKDMDIYNTDMEKYTKDLQEHEKTELANIKNNKGIFTGVYDNIMDGMKAIIDKSGPGQDSDLLRGVKSNMLIDFVTKKGSISDLDKSVMEMNKQIDNLTVLLAKKEDSYYAKFTAMEKYMYQMNGQSGWLAQQFG